MTLDLAFAVSMMLGLFGIVTMALAQSKNTALRRWAPIVGLVGQLAWSYYAVLLGPKAGGLWILIVLYAGVYLHGVWMHWDMRRRLWKRLGLWVPGRCTGCGAKLNAQEITYYEHTCDRCEGAWSEAMEASA